MDSDGVDFTLEKAKNLPTWFIKAWGGYVIMPGDSTTIAVYNNTVVADNNTPTNFFRCTQCNKYTGSSEMYIPLVVYRTWWHYNEQHQEFMAMKLLEYLGS